MSVFSNMLILLRTKKSFIIIVKEFLYDIHGILKSNLENTHQRQKTRKKNKEWACEHPLDGVLPLDSGVTSKSLVV